MGKRKELPPEISFLTADDKDKFVTEEIKLKRSFNYRKVQLKAGAEMAAVKYVKIDEKNNFDLVRLSCPEWFTLCKMFKIPNASRMRIEHMRVCIAKAINEKNEDGKSDNDSSKQAGRRQLPLIKQETAQDTTNNNGKEESSSLLARVNENASAGKGNGKASTSKESTSAKAKDIQSKLKSSKTTVSTKTKDVQSKPNSSEATETEISTILSHSNKGKQAVTLEVSKATSLSSTAASKLAETTLAMLSIGAKLPVDLVARLGQAETDLVNAAAAVGAARVRAIALNRLMAMEDDASDDRPTKKPRHSK